MKKLSTFMAALALILCTMILVSSPVEAKRGPHKVRFQKVKCSQEGQVTVFFRRQVTWSEDKAVAVTDADGNAKTVTVSKWGKKKLVFTVDDLTDGKYTVTISGVKSSKAETYETVTKTFTFKKKTNDVKIKKVSAHRRLITVKFMHAVEYKDDMTAVITDESGATVASAISDKHSRSLRIKAENALEKGKTYTVTITGVKCKSASDYSTVSKSFSAR